MPDRDNFELIDHTASMAWLDDSACADLPLEELELFFVEAGRSISGDTVARCATCPARAQCLEHAYRHQIVSGYFGGMSPGKRRSLSLSEALVAIGVTPGGDAGSSDRS